MIDTKRVAMITGANRGLGLVASRTLARGGMTVVMSGRDRRALAEAVEALMNEGLDVHAAKLDVTNPADIHALVSRLRGGFGRCDILVNNAAILLEVGGSDSARQPPVNLVSPMEVPLDIVRRTMEVNALAPFRLIKALVPLMRTHNYGRIVNVSSGWGQFAGMYPEGGHPAYRMSKVALNVQTCIFHHELKDTNILVNAMDPGWMRTRMGGPEADREPEVSARDILWLATLPDDGPRGGLFRDGKPIPW